MGKGGMSHGDAGNVEGENMAAWLLGINNLKIQPFKLPPLGIHHNPLYYHLCLIIFTMITNNLILFFLGSLCQWSFFKKKKRRTNS